MSVRSLSPNGPARLRARLAGLVTGRLPSRSRPQRFDALAHLSTEVVVVVDDAGVVRFVTPSLEAVLGYRPYEVTATLFADLVHPDDRPAVESLADTGRAVVRLRHDDGSWRWVELTRGARVDVPGVRGVVHSLRDVSERRAAEEARSASERRFLALAAAAPIGIYELDGKGDVTYLNDRWVEISGRPDSHLADGDFWAGVHPDDVAEAAAWPFPAGEAASDPTAAGEYRARFRIFHPDGSLHWVIGQTAPVLGDDGRVEGHVGMVLDVTDLVDARQDALRFQAIIETTTDLVGLTDGSGRPLFLNRAARDALGIAPHADIGHLDPAQLYSEESWRTIRDDALPAVLRGGVWSGELELRRSGGGPDLPISNVVLAAHRPGGGLDFIASIARDMSEQKGLEALLQYQADHDQLTGLPNRHPLVSHLSAVLREVERVDAAVAVLFCDIDRFKVLNDSLGHHAGDQVLVAMAKRLRRAIRPHDRIGRFGGDEFVVICNTIGGADEAVQVAERIRREIGGRFSIGDEEVYVTVSIGVAVADDCQSPDELLRDADAAMYEAKAGGRDRVEVFNLAVRDRVVERLGIEQALRRALDRDELRLHYQPLVDLPGGRIRGVEALVRWEHPERGLLPPAQFLSVAEETGLIVDVGRWVLTEACQLARHHLRDPETGERLPMFVNLSARQLVDVNLVPMVEEVIDLTGVEPQVVHFEITEDALMADADTTTSTLRQLRRLGVRLALDDFGTGHSSLAYLKQFPVEVLKIDRTFVEGLGRDRGDSALTAAIVNVARLFGLSTVAEGVERLDQATELHELGCDLAQGFHFARPMSAEHLRGLLTDTATVDPAVGASGYQPL